MREQGLGSQPDIRAFFDEPTNTVSYLVWNPGTMRGVVIDPVLDFDPASGVVDDGSVNELLRAVEGTGIAIEWVLETHVHADHLSGAPLIKQRTGARVAIGEHVREVQTIFRPIFGAEDVKADGGDFDRLLGEGDRLEVGGLEIEVLYTPGHTPACVSYKIDDAVFVGDTMFMPDYGTARTDFPAGDARKLYHSMQRVFELPPETRIFVCHDYMPNGRPLAFETTVEAQRRDNEHLKDNKTEDRFVGFRKERDKTLTAPNLILPAIQVNIRAGRMPPPEANGKVYLKLPLDTI